MINRGTPGGSVYTAVCVHHPEARSNEDSSRERRRHLKLGRIIQVIKEIVTCNR